MESKAKQGEKNRAAGARFERKVRADLEVKGWTVSRWGNNVAIVGSKNPFEWEGMGKLVPAKSTRFRSNTHGFPDFIVFSKILIASKGEKRGEIKYTEFR